MPDTVPVWVLLVFVFVALHNAIMGYVLGRRSALKAPRPPNTP